MCSFSADLSVGAPCMGCFHVGANAPAWPSLRSESLDGPPDGISGLSAGERSAGGLGSAYGVGARRLISAGWPEGRWANNVRYNREI